MNPTIKRWAIFAIVLVILTLLMAMCLGGGDANASVISTEPVRGDAFVVFPTKFLSAKDIGQCWQWDFGPWESHDGIGRLRFGYGEKFIACTNSKGTLWASVPTFSPYHYLGYWSHDSTTKKTSALGYSWLDTSTTWKFSWYPGFGMPTYHKDRTIRCAFYASNHTGVCTRYY